MAEATKEGTLVSVPSRPGHTALQITLGFLLAFVAFNAVAGGLYGLAGAEGVPLAWLEGSPFRDYVIPSLTLMVAVGGSQIVAVIAVAARPPWAGRATTAAGIILLGWIAAQVLIIGFVSWLQPAMFLAGAAIIVLSAYAFAPSR